MGQKSMHSRDSAEQTVRAIRRKTRKQYSAEEKIRIVVAAPPESPKWMPRAAPGASPHTSRSSTGK